MNGFEENVYRKIKDNKYLIEYSSDKRIRITTIFA